MSYDISDMSFVALEVCFCLVVLYHVVKIALNYIWLFIN